MQRVRQIAGSLVIAAYAAVLLVPCGGMARPLSETRVMPFCECPAHSAHGGASAVPLDSARVPMTLIVPPPHPRFAICEAWEPSVPLEPALELTPPVPRA